jgi:hypothetical protein
LCNTNTYSNTNTNTYSYPYPYPYSNTYRRNNNMPSTRIMERLEYLLWRNTEKIKN